MNQFCCRVSCRGFGLTWASRFHSKASQPSGPLEQCWNVVFFSPKHSFKNLNNRNCMKTNMLSHFKIKEPAFQDHSSKDNVYQQDFRNDFQHFLNSSLRTPGLIHIQRCSLCTENTPALCAIEIARGLGGIQPYTSSIQWKGLLRWFLCSQKPSKVHPKWMVLLSRAILNRFASRLKDVGTEVFHAEMFHGCMA